MNVVQRCQASAVVVLVAVLFACSPSSSSDTPGSSTGAAEPGALAIDPTTAQVAPGEVVAFTASVSGTSTSSVLWTVVEDGGGTLDAQGLYAAPQQAGTFHVVATSAADATKTSTATVTVTATGTTGTPVAFGPGSVYFVSHGGSDGASGSIGSPWKTLATSINKLRAGDTLYIRGGSSDADDSSTAPLTSRTCSDANTCWDENIYWNSSLPSGTDESHRITVVAYPGEKVRLMPTTCFGAAFYVSGASAQYVTLSGLIFDGRFCASGQAGLRLDPDQLGAGLVASTGPQHWRIQNCEARYARGSGIMIYGGRYHEIIDSEMHHNGTDGKNHGHGIYVQASNTIVKGTAAGKCLIHDNMSDGIQNMVGYGATADNNTYRNCDVYRNGQNDINAFRSCTQSGASGSGDYAYCFDGNGQYTPADASFPDCTCHTTNVDNVAAVGMYTGSGLVVDGNRIHDNRHNGMGSEWSSTQYLTISNNRIYGNATAHPASGVGIRISDDWGDGAPSNVTFLDNVLWNNPANGNSAPSNQVYVTSGATGVSGLSTTTLGP